MRTVYREKRYYCGEYLDVFIFPVYSSGKRGSRGRKGKPTSAAQKKLNQRHREEKLVRLLHANFTPEDLELHLTYAEQPEDDEAAKRELANFLRRVRRYRKKNGLEPLKYIAVTERGKQGGRYHHHVTLNGGYRPGRFRKAFGGSAMPTPAACSSRRTASPVSETTS
jgi:hypothetical protein